MNGERPGSVLRPSVEAPGHELFANCEVFSWNLTLAMTPQWCHTDVMDLDRYVSGIRSQLIAAAETGSDDARVVAERLSTSLDAVARLVLLEALSDAASEITRELAPGSVDVRLRGRDPEFVVSRPAAAEPESQPTTAGAPAPTGEVSDDDTATSRTTLRLPDQLKVRVDAAAAESGLSVNAWLVRAISASLEPKNRRSASRESRSGDSFIGWVS